MDGPASFRPYVARIGSELFGEVPDARYIPSDESYAYELTFDRLAPRIVKFEKPGEWFVRREQKAFPALHARGFSEFPRLEYTQDDVPGIDVAFNVMPKAPSVPLNRLWREDPGLAVDVVAHMGDFLKRLSVVPWEEVPGAISPEQRVVHFPGWFDMWWTPLRGQPLIAEGIIDALIASMQVAPKGFGNWSGGAVLSDGRSFTAIDWANIGSFWPLCDLASRTGLDEFGPGASDELLPVLLDSYTGGTGLNDDDAAELRRWHAVWALFGAGGAWRRGDHDGVAVAATSASRFWSDSRSH